MGIAVDDAREQIGLFPLGNFCEHGARGIGGKGGIHAFRFPFGGRPHKIRIDAEEPGGAFQGTRHRTEPRKRVRQRSL